MDCQGVTIHSGHISVVQIDRLIDNITNTGSDRFLQQELGVLLCRTGSRHREFYCARPG